MYEYSITDVFVSTARTVSYPTIDPENKHDGEVFLIKLTEPIQFNSYASPICLPRQDELIPAGMKCWTTGWGVLHG